ncbi:MAG TPA: SDR family NAD(P)-dependent oxidoreductase [Aquella sp.]|nr:SDR family NAD(P)-dependent oxidoreductase [Aquella sp.]
MKNFINKVALITGAASGIGRGIALKCAYEQMKVVIVDIDRDNLEKVKHELLQITPHVLALQKDISNLSEIKDMISHVRHEYSSINLLVNNAGVSGPLGPVWELPTTQLEWTIKVNLSSIIYSLQSIIPLMIKQDDECHIVNISSHVGLNSNPHLTAYQITKHAITTLTETLEQDLRIAGHDKINASVFFPYFVKSNLANSGRHLKNNEKLHVSENSKEFLKTLANYTDNGIDTLTAAEILFNGIIGNNLYIFTDDETKKAFKSRADAILQP